MCPPELAWDNGGVSRLIQVSTFVSFSLQRHKTLLITCCLFYHLFDQCENGDTVNMIFVETLGDVLIWIFCHFVMCLFVSACSSPSHSGAGQTARMPVIKLLSLRLTEWRQKGGNRQRGHRGDSLATRVSRVFLGLDCLSDDAQATALTGKGILGCCIVYFSFLRPAILKKVQKVVRVAYSTLK